MILGAVLARQMNLLAESAHCFAPFSRLAFACFGPTFGLPLSAFFYFQLLQKNKVCGDIFLDLLYCTTLQHGSLSLYLIIYQISSSTMPYKHLVLRVGLRFIRERGAELYRTFDDMRSCIGFSSSSLTDTKRRTPSCFCACSPTC